MAGPSGAGELDKRITFRRATVAANGFNEQIPTWSDFATVWAKAVDASAGETYRAQEVGASITVRFTVRWSAKTADVDAKDRVLYAGREHDIVGVRNVGRRTWREIDAVARADQ